MRNALLYILVLVTGLFFIGRLFYLQVIEDKFKHQSENNAFKRVRLFPERGHVYDRNNNLLVANQPAYDLMVIPSKVKAFDTLALCDLLDIDKQKLVKQLKKARRYSPRLPSPVVAQMSKIEYASLQEKIRKFTGFYVQKRSVRDYQTSIGANVLGYIAEVSQRDLKKNPYYQSGDLYGKAGIEKSYEDILRGKKGVKYVQKDKFNRDIGSYKNGKLDTLPENGKDVTVTIDAVLQQYGEELMVNKRGGIIAIEPSSGEILSLVTAPSYAPSLLVGRKRSKNYTQLYYDSIAKPLYDRSLKGAYPPGSPFKLLNALIALEEGVIDEKTKITCNHGLHYGAKKPLGCHCPFGTRNDLNRAIFESCNAYFGKTYLNILNKYPNSTIGVQKWSEHAKSFGLGNFLNNDLSVGTKGLIPDSTYYNQMFGKNKLRSTYIISNSIGQGHVSTTPIQLANMTAAIANRGYYYTPHIVKQIKDDSLPKKFITKRITTISPEHFEPVIKGMLDVYEKPRGTAYYSRIEGIDICGKTGTSEVYAKIDGVRTQLDDHSIFVAFAPKDNPKIAIAVFVENGFWGSRYAAPIASLMIEKYIKGTISRKDLEEKMLNRSLQHVYDSYISGEPFEINRKRPIQ